MASPRGQYTPHRGPLAGRTFSSYFQYQQERSHLLGFTSYSEERRLKSDPVFQSLEYRMVDVQGIPHFEARQQVQAEMKKWGHARDRASGIRKHNAIKFAIDNGLYDSGDDARDEIPY